MLRRAARGRRVLSRPVPVRSTASSPFGADLQPLAPSQLAGSPTGSIEYSACDTRTLYYLCATLNASFPDYDFINTKSQSFTQESCVELVASNINMTMLAEHPDFASIRDELWAAVEREIEPRNCGIFRFALAPPARSAHKALTGPCSYMPDADLDNPYTEEGCVWSFNYLFYNKHLKRILFISCICMSRRDCDMSADRTTLDGPSPLWSDTMSMEEGEGTAAAAAEEKEKTLAHSHVYSVHPSDYVRAAHSGRQRLDDVSMVL